MKRALQANINNKVFYIDEDAYNLLQNYLHQLADAFSGPESKEIVDDIECRASELLTEKVEAGKNVIDIQCIYNVIETIGSPEELGELAGNQSKPQGGEGGGEIAPPPYQAPKEPKPQKKLYRDPNDKVLGGVVGGLAKYLGWNAGVMRVLLVILAVTTYVMPVFICYLIAWMVIPLANTPRKKLEMEGREVTFDSVAQSLRDSAQEQLRKIDSRNVGQAATSLIGAVCKVFAGLLALAFAAAGFACLIGVFVAIFMPFSGIGAHGWMINGGSGLIFPSVAACAWFGCLCLALAILMGVMAWGIGAAAFSWKRISAGVLLALGVIMAILIAVFIVLSIYFMNMNVNPFRF
ncbi:MAG: PspC domain-containing protein [Lachnospiraceae bacterium]|nr:PspC domain-containing protein [Lachnospiraceae bacterium]